MHIRNEHKYTKSSPQRLSLCELTIEKQTAVIQEIAGVAAQFLSVPKMKAEFVLKRKDVDIVLIKYSTTFHCWKITLSQKIKPSGIQLHKNIYRCSNAQL